MSFPFAHGRLLVLGLVCGLAGCAGPRFVALGPDGGGVVAMPTNSDTWPCYFRGKAETMMRQRCPAGYVIDHEEEVVVNTIEHTDTDTDRSGSPLLAIAGIAPVTEKAHQTTHVTNETEWRITFHPAGPLPEGSPMQRVGPGLDHSLAPVPEGPPLPVAEPPSK